MSNESINFNKILRDSRETLLNPKDYFESLPLAGALIGLFIGGVIMLVISAICGGNTDYEASVRIVLIVLVILALLGFFGGRKATKSLRDYTDMFEEEMVE